MWTASCHHALLCYAVSASPLIMLSLGLSGAQIKHFKTVLQCLNKIGKAWCPMCWPTFSVCMHIWDHARLPIIQYSLDIDALTRTHTHTHAHKHTRMNACMHPCSCTHACAHIHTHARARTHTHTHIHAHTHACTCTNTRAHTCTNTHTHMRTIAISAYLRTSARSKARLSTCTHHVPCWFLKHVQEIP